jgi:hypothetical protein
MTGDTVRKARPIGGAVVGVLVGVIVLGMIYLGVQTYSLASSIREQQKTNSSTNATILDCTEPSGECYRKSQERTAAVVADIGKVSAYASACADRPGVQGEAEVLACVLERLKKDDAAASR